MRRFIIFSTDSVGDGGGGVKNSKYVSWIFVLSVV